MIKNRITPKKRWLFLIAAPGQEPVYTANRVTAKETPQANFAVTVPEAGVYRIRLSAKKAAGSLQIRMPD